MLRIFADDPDLSFSLDYLALIAHRFNRRSDFHEFTSSLLSIQAYSKNAFKEAATRPFKKRPF
jgi:hypothetical protein